MSEMITTMSKLDRILMNRKAALWGYILGLPILALYFAAMYFWTVDVVFVGPLVLLVAVPYIVVKDVREKRAQHQEAVARYGTAASRSTRF